MVVVLSLMNVVMDYSFWLSMVSLGEIYIASLGIAAGYIWAVIPLWAVGFMVGRVLAYVAASKIIKRSKLLEYYPLT